MPHYATAITMSDPSSSMNKFGIYRNFVPNVGAEAAQRPKPAASTIDLTSLGDRFSVVVDMTLEHERIDSAINGETLKLRLPMIRVVWTPRFPEINEPIASALKPIRGSMLKGKLDGAGYFVIPPETHDQVAARLSSLRVRAPHPIKYKQELDLRREAALAMGQEPPTTLPPGTVPEVSIDVNVNKEALRAVQQALEPWKKLQQYYRQVRAGETPQRSLIAPYLVVETTPVQPPQQSQPLQQPTATPPVPPIGSSIPPLPSASVTSAAPRPISGVPPIGSSVPVVPGIGASSIPPVSGSNVSSQIAQQQANAPQALPQIPRSAAVQPLPSPSSSSSDEITIVSASGIGQAAAEKHAKLVADSLAKLATAEAMCRSELTQVQADIARYRRLLESVMRSPVSANAGVFKTHLAHAENKKREIEGKLREIAALVTDIRNSQPGKALPGDPNVALRTGHPSQPQAPRTVAQSFVQQTPQPFNPYFDSVEIPGMLPGVKPSTTNPTTVQIERFTPTIQTSIQGSADSNLMMNGSINIGVINLLRNLPLDTRGQLQQLTSEEEQNLGMQADALKQLISCQNRLSDEEIRSSLKSIIPENAGLSVLHILTRLAEDAQQSMSMQVQIDRSLLSGPWPNVRRIRNYLHEQYEQIRKRTASRALGAVPPRPEVYSGFASMSTMPRVETPKSEDDTVIELKAESLEDIELEEWDGTEDYYENHNFDHLLEKEFKENDVVQGITVNHSGKTGVPKKLFSALYGFQKAGVDFVYSHGGRALIGDEMGCGKTLQAIAAACLYRHQWPVLVVCPASLKLNWVQEFFRWCSDFLKASSVQVIDSGKARIPTYPTGTEHVYITGYQLVPSIYERLASANIGVIIADESHYIKSAKAKRTKVMTSLIRLAPRAILLSGTPIISRPSEIYEQIAALCPGKFGTARDFQSKYGGDVKMGQRVKRAQLERLKNLYKLLRTTVMIRRLKKQVLKFLQPKTRTTIRGNVHSSAVLESAMRLAPEIQAVLAARIHRSMAAQSLESTLGPSERGRNENSNSNSSSLTPVPAIGGPLPGIPRFSDTMGDTSRHGGNDYRDNSQLVPLPNQAAGGIPNDGETNKNDDEDFFDEDDDDSERTLNRLESLHKMAKRGTMRDKERRWLATVLYRETSKVKIPYVKEYVSEMIEAGAKFLVFAHHRDVLNALEEVCKEQNVGYIRIDGQTKPALRSQYVDSFQNSSQVRVGILSITAAGVGLTLTAADIVVFAELYWTPAALLQAEDRVHRVGQPNAVNVYYLLAHNTIDDLLWTLLETKLAILSHSLDGQGDDAFEQTRDHLASETLQEIRANATGSDPNDGAPVDPASTEAAAAAAFIEKVEKKSQTDSSPPPGIKEAKEIQSDEAKMAELWREWESHRKSLNSAKETRNRKTNLLKAVTEEVEDRALSLLKRAKLDYEQESDIDDDIVELKVMGTGLNFKPRHKVKLPLASTRRSSPIGTHMPLSTGTDGRASSSASSSSTTQRESDEPERSGEEVDYPDDSSETKADEEEGEEANQDEVEADEDDDLVIVDTIGTSYAAQASRSLEDPNEWSALGDQFGTSDPPAFASIYSAHNGYGASSSSSVPSSASPLATSPSPSYGIAPLPAPLSELDSPTNSPHLQGSNPIAGTPALAFSGLDSYEDYPDYSEDPPQLETFHVQRKYARDDESDPSETDSDAKRTLANVQYSTLNEASYQRYGGPLGDEEEEVPPLE